MNRGRRISAIASALLMLAWLVVAGPAEAGVSSLGIGSDTVAPGQTTTLSLSAKASGTGIAAYIIDVRYDGSLVEATECTSLAGACSVNKIDTDTVRLVGASAAALNGDLTLGTVTFVAGPAEGMAILAVTVVQLTDPRFFDIPVTPIGGTIGIVTAPFGDVDCDLDVDSVDSLKELQHVAGLAVSQTEPCPDIGSEVASLFGDVDCDNDIDAIDSLTILRFLAGLPVSQREPCPDIGG